jgi:hypothetical protein
MTLAELFDSLGVEYRLPGQHHHVTRGWVGTDCPLCSLGSKKFKLGWRRGGATSCWSCGTVSPPYALCLLAGIGYEEAKALVGGSKDLAPDKRLAEARRHKLVKPDTSPVMRVRPFRTPATRYLEDRGFSMDYLSRVWSIDSVVLLGPLGGRIYIPIFKDGVEVSWTARAADSVTQPRYRNCPAEHEAYPAKSLLYGEWHCRGACVIVEGPTDAWRIGPGAVATMGVSYGRAQLLRMTQFPVRAVCFDREPGAQKRARELCALLSAFPGETHLITLETGNDPGDCDEQEVAEIRRRFLDG